MSALLLSELLDRLLSEGRAAISESEAIVVVSELSSPDAAEILNLSSSLGWADTAVDQADTPWIAQHLTVEFAPFRISLVKPIADNETLLILTKRGFSKFLASNNDAKLWRLASLRTPFHTLGKCFLNWETQVTFEPSCTAKSPRELTREHGGTRLVPQDICPWLLRETEVPTADPVFHIWADFAARNILKSLSNELAIDSRTLKFNGPPKLQLCLPPQEENLYLQIGGDTFLALTKTASWAFENARETELRHSLLATEIARSGNSNLSIHEYLRTNIADAFDSAKIAYQMSISELGLNTLKALSDLRKTITEDTSKVAEATRQLVTSITGAIAVGIGLFAARLTTNASPWLIIAVMIVITVYIAVTIFSGFQFINLQRQIRENWQAKLYRFLSEQEYKKMVLIPTSHAERTFFISAMVGGAAVLVLTITVFVNAMSSANVQAPKLENQKITEKQVQSQSKALIEQTKNDGIPKEISSSKIEFSKSKDKQ